MCFSEPCQPVIVSAQTVCNTTEVQISWHQARGVVSYMVAASGSLGYTSVHNTTQTLLLAAVPCGQEYNVTVQGRGNQCVSLPSSPAFFKSGNDINTLKHVCLQSAYLYLTVYFTAPSIFSSLYPP